MLLFSLNYLQNRWIYFFAVCISLSSITACMLFYWYRQGDLEPKFRNLIYYILFSIIMLCICANLYFHDVGKWGCQEIHSPGLFKAIYLDSNKSWIRYAEESPAEVWYMIFMLIVNLNSLLQGRHILNHFAFSLRSRCCTQTLPLKAQIIFTFEIFYIK